MSKSRQRTTAGSTNIVTEYNLEEMIEYLRRNLNAAFDVHKHLTQITQPQHLNFNAPIESPTPQTSKRNLDTSDNNGIQVLKQQRILSNEKQKNTDRINLSIATNAAHVP
ncbi:unnamed protein product, partial [Rotaria sp. Silwood2]